MKVCWLVTMEAGDNLRPGEIERVREALVAAAKAVEPLTNVHSREFWIIPGPKDELPAG